jgi:hypothetical protein
VPLETLCDRKLSLSDIEKFEYACEEDYYVRFGGIGRVVGVWLTPALGRSLKCLWTTCLCTATLVSTSMRT